MTEPKIEIKANDGQFSIFIDGDYYKSYSTRHEAERDMEMLKMRNKHRRKLLQESIKHPKTTQRIFKP